MKLISVVLLVAMSVFEVQAQQLYKWVDAEGVTHYSETLPNKNIDHVALEFTQDYQVPNHEDDYYSVQNQLKRLQQRRSQQLAEKKQVQVAKQTPEIVYVQVSEPERNYYLPAYFPHFKSHHYNGKYNTHYPKHARYKQRNAYLEKPKSGISQKVRASRVSAGFSASR